MRQSKIEWTDATWNPFIGCSHVSDGCRNCYAERIAARFSNPGMQYERVVIAGRWSGFLYLVNKFIENPLHWRKPQRIFVNSMSDLFHEDVPDEWIDRVFAVMALAPHHTFQILTKRPKRMAEYLRRWAGHYNNKQAIALVPFHNVWLGVSIEDQKTADERIPLLLQTPAALRFISCEPLLGPINLGAYIWAEGHIGKKKLPSVPSYILDWVITGGESGHYARPMHPDWARSLRDQCRVVGVPFFFKQWGEWIQGKNKSYSLFQERNAGGFEIHTCLHTTGSRKDIGKESYYPIPADFRGGPAGIAKMVRVGKKAAGCLLDGREHKEFPRV